MDTKSEMHKVSDHLMKEIAEHTSQTKRKLESLEVFVKDPAGKAIVDETFNEISKMGMKVKDYH